MEIQLLPEFSHAIYNESNDAFFVFQTDTLEVIDANPTAQRLSKYKKKELVGMTLTQLFSSDIDSEVLKLSDACKSTSFFHSREEYHLITKDGASLPLNVSVTRIHVEPEPLGLIVARDISERKRTEEDREKMHAQILHTQKLESLGVLAGGIAHDFNNLLMGVIGNADLASTYLEPESPANDNIKEIINAGHKAADLCRQMLAYAGKGRFVVRPVDVSRIARDMRQLLEVSVSKPGTLTYNLGESLPAVAADPTQIRQTIMNLVTNSSEAVGDHKGAISLTTSLVNCNRETLDECYLGQERDEGEYVCIEVQDTGCGMDEETCSKIFDPFFSTKFLGRGLGLAAVLGIVRSHDGALSVTSVPSEGTTFRIYLPSSGSPTEKAVAALIVEEPAWQPHGTILLVDDEETVRSVVQRTLERHGFDVIAAKDGREALELFKKHRNEIRTVLLDMTMPEMSGAETFRELRKIQDDVCVILSSGYNEDDAMERFGETGLAGFIHKPFHENALLSRLREVLTK